MARAGPTSGPSAALEAAPAFAFDGAPAATTPATASDAVGPEGHRKRLKQRFEASGGTGLADYEFLELFLFRAIPRRDTKPIAKALLKAFGSFAGVLAAPPERLREVAGVGEAVVFDLKLVKAAIGRAAREEASGRDVLTSWDQVIAYCRVAMAHAAREEFRVLFLDKKNRLIADEVQGVGTVDHTPVYPREVVKRALELSASAIVLVHNHPSGDPQPSRADIAMTRQLVDLSAALGITIHDHIIIGRSGNASLRALGHL